MEGWIDCASITWNLLYIYCVVQKTLNRTVVSKTDICSEIVLVECMVFKAVKTYSKVSMLPFCPLTRHWHQVTKKSAETQKERSLAAVSLNSAEKLLMCVFNPVTNNLVCMGMCVVLASLYVKHAYTIIHMMISLWECVNVSISEYLFGSVCICTISCLSTGILPPFLSKQTLWLPE